MFLFPVPTNSADSVCHNFYHEPFESPFRVESMSIFPFWRSFILPSTRIVAGLAGSWRVPVLAMSVLFVLFVLFMSCFHANSLMSCLSGLCRVSRFYFINILSESFEPFVSLLAPLWPFTLFRSALVFVQ